MLSVFINEFIVFAVILGVLFLIAGCLLIQNWRGSLVGGGIGIIVALIVGLLSMTEYSTDIQTFNNGYCDKCQVEYNFINTFTKGRFGSEIYHTYQCPNCNKIIEVRNEIQ